ncbi:Tlg2-vesicle protein [Psilocybe cubensis]|uniref:Tlg2-vesicle protein n=2 Tax=Psilocybe cubensis TaxID=181762 RepID=A0ACB8H5E7_PSICU|nr:Tlg2-vesicle protein [Psilocybe cubensis]KAH9482932.1 Tlg2-vesicle protein [Psilocybe cubensis]
MSVQPLARLVAFVKKYASYALNRYRKLHLYGKIFLWLVVFFDLCLLALIIVITPAKIAQVSHDKAILLASTRFGWLALGGLMVCVSFPPLIGHTTLITLCGFAYGMKGFYISSTASVLGSALAFVSLRFLFSNRLQAWSSKNKKWQALEAVVTAKGLPLIILIRISPFPPWVYSNSLFASIQAVKLWQFVVATLFIFPKVFLHTFIGSKLAELSDGEQRDHMDTRTKILDGVFIGVSIVIALFTGWTVYNSVQSHIRHLEGFSPEVDELAAEAIEDYDEEAPLLSPQQT